MWQLVYKVIATQKWRYPTRNAADESTWCTRCMGGHQEDVTHCIWSCTQSRQCWTWVDFILDSVASLGPGYVRVTPAQIFIADPLPTDWGVPEQMWHLLRAVMCWQLRKDKNEHIFEGTRSDPVKVICKSWHRLGMYIRLEWRSLSNRVRLEKITYVEAEAAMKSQFGSNPAIWNLHERILQVPPVPPRPP